jgi:hypothetical protein
MNMPRTAVVSPVVLALFLCLTTAKPARAEELSPEYKKAVEKGLTWVAKNQNADGHWDANGGAYPVTMTALGGMALLMEGSTIRDGKYSEKIRKATDWLMDRSQRSGMIGNPNNPTEAGRYMYGHGFSVLFLSQVYGEEEDGDRRKKLEGILTRAVEFTGKAQTDRGGWGYVSAADGGGFDEGSVTITQLQGLRAARNAGIRVPKGIIDKAQKYLKVCTTDRGGVIYSLAHGGRAAVGGERAPLTAAAVACSFSAGEYNNALTKKWLLFCKDSIPLGGGGRFGHDEYTHYYYSQALYILGDKGYEKIIGSKDGPSWSKYRKAMFDNLVRSQNADGSWAGGGGIGTIYSTSINLTIMQLDNGTLPIYQR